MKLHLERTDNAVRPKDTGKRVTMCGLQIGGIGIDERDVTTKRSADDWLVCENCAWVSRSYARRAKTDITEEAQT